MPDYIVIGGQRCGTTSLSRYLWEHPNVIPAMRKEVHFFDLHFDRGIRWYRGHFPTRGRRTRMAAARGGFSLTGEATPYYLFHPLAPERIARTLPDIQLIVLLRDPVARAVSHYHHERSTGVETSNLADALELEDERLAGEEDRIVRDPEYVSFAHQHFSYKARGRYASQLSRWFTHFPTEQILIIESDAFFRNPVREFERVRSFLRLPGDQRGSFKRHNTQRYDKDPEVISKLRDLFEPVNQDLYDLLGRDLGWQR